MSFIKQVSTVFPGVFWHGGSHIHVSIFAEGGLDIPFSNRPGILHALMTKDVGGAIYDMLQKRFGKMEWVLERDVFSKLFLVDIDLQLQGKATSDSPHRIQNPATGNWFHRVALLPPYVGGVRFWAEDYDGTTAVGFRFRIVKMVDESEEVDVRAEAREREATVLLEVSSVYDAVMDIAEPPKADLESATQLLKAFA